MRSVLSSLLSPSCLSNSHLHSPSHCTYSLLLRRFWGPLRYWPSFAPTLEIMPRIVTQVYIISSLSHTHISSYRLFGSLSLRGNYLRTAPSYCRSTVRIGQFIFVFSPLPIMYSSSPPLDRLCPFIIIIMAIHELVMSLIIRDTRAGGPLGQHP
eukprot:TRINITY_DN15801_c0_g1_i1.p1 TRINITY_DN15801_c0_g1~~TRINITY_DN15801_c0_g1_i1.p1  ORF type:complete len:154 (+),score=9.72 TRINITY_DN15801_c0_g1_i1:409-870(+)